jgi:Ca2+-binding RTX toxin-like protein
VIDDGFDYLHSDLAPNYDTSLDFDFDEVDLDPFGGASDAHGTAVTGIIGAAANGTGVVGIAYNSSIVGYRTHGFITDFWLQNIRDAIHHAAASANGDVVNISQGIANDLNSEFGVGYNAVRFDEIETSIGTAVNTGRGGLGTIIVKSAGNSRGGSYDVNADDWSNDTRQVVVAAVDQNGFVSSYSSYGAAVLVSGFGTPGQVVTTDRTGAAGYDPGDFTSSFNGTSSAAPMVTGVVGLMLEANGDLGWRDVQSILAASARHVGSAVGGGIAGSERHAWEWNAATTWNGGGMHFSNDYGYGLVDAHGAVRLAETWLLTGTSAATSANEFTNTMDVLNTSTVIPDGNATGLSFTGNAAFDDIIDRVTVEMTFSTTFTGDLEVYLTSPDGTEKLMIRDTGGSNDFNGTWTFESQAFRGERAAGTWTVRVVDDAGSDVLTVTDIIIRTWGAASTNDRYIYTDEYADYAGVGGHSTAVTDSNGGTDTVNAAAVTTNSVIRLDGVAGNIAGQAASFSGIENAIGGDGNDTIIGNGFGNMLFGMRGADSLNGGDGTDALYGGTGNDTLSQSFGGPNETLDGGAGNDTADWSYNNFDSWVIDLADGTAKIGGTTYAHLISIENAKGGQSSDSITGTSGNNRLEGNNGADTLDGGSGTDSLYGGAGNDVLIQNFGGPNEIMDGGDGNDTGDWTYNTSDNWVISLLDGTARIGGTAYAQLTSIENLRGGGSHDSLIGDSGDNRLEGGLGNDTLNGLAGGTDTLGGGQGNDLYRVGSSTTIIEETGGQGSDTVYSAVSFSLAANDSIERLGTIASAATTAINLTGNALAQVITGNAGNNVLNDGGAGGNDTLYGYGGNDTYRVYNAGTQIEEAGGQGSDTVYSAVSFSLAANDSIERLGTIASAATTAINLTGNALSQTITGNAGQNRLNGGAGNDTISGFGGNDTFVFNTALGAGNVDTVTDFTAGGDRIELENAVFTGLATGVLAASAFVANLTGIATTAAQRIIYETDTGDLFFDADGSGAGARVRFATLDAGLGLANTDFLVV